MDEVTLDVKNFETFQAPVSTPQLGVGKQRISVLDRVRRNID